MACRNSRGRRFATPRVIRLSAFLFWNVVPRESRWRWWVRNLFSLGASAERASQGIQGYSPQFPWISRALRGNWVFPNCTRYFRQLSSLLIYGPFAPQSVWPKEARSSGNGSWTYFPWVTVDDRSNYYGWKKELHILCFWLYCNFNNPL